MSQVQSAGNQEPVILARWKSPVRKGAMVITTRGIRDTTARMYPARAPFLSPFEFMMPRDPKITAPTIKESRVSGKAEKAGTSPLR